MVVVTVLLAATLLSDFAQQAAEMTADVSRMIRASRDVPLMPWSAPVQEIDRVVRHGRAVVPLLIVLLPDDADDPSLTYETWNERDILAGKQFEWRAQQQAAVALCRIYRIPAASCRMYSNRATREYNRGVKPFWLKTIAENP